MNQEKVSILSTFVNFGLAASKLFFGLVIGSTALIADGIHSGIDIVSSFGTYLGIKIAKKPVDEKHPYGHYRAETLAGLFITILLAITGVWIIYESIGKLFGEKQEAYFSIGAIILVVVTIIINETMARVKFHYGRKYKSLSLVADAEHTRADVLSSFGVLISLSLVKYFSPIDGIVAFLIGGYILFDQTEALVAIDVNSGKYVSKGSHDDSSLKINLEAAAHKGEINLIQYKPHEWREKIKKDVPFHSEIIKTGFLRCIEFPFRAFESS